MTTQFDRNNDILDRCSRNISKYSTQIDSDQRSLLNMQMEFLQQSIALKQKNLGYGAVQRSKSQLVYPRSLNINISNYSTANIDTNKVYQSTSLLNKQELLNTNDLSSIKNNMNINEIQVPPEENMRKSKNFRQFKNSSIAIESLYNSIRNTGDQQSKVEQSEVQQQLLRSLNINTRDKQQQILDYYKRQINQISDENEHLKQQLQKYNQLQFKYEYYQRQGIDIEVLIKQNQQYQNYKQLLHEKSSQNAELQHQIEQLEQKMANLLFQYDNQLSKQELNQQIICSLEDKNQKYLKNIEQLKQQIEQINMYLHTEQQKQEIENQQTGNEKLNKEIREYKIQNIQLNDVINQQKEELFHKDDIIAQLQQNLQDMQQRNEIFSIQENDAIKQTIQKKRDTSNNDDDATYDAQENDFDDADENQQIAAAHEEHYDGSHENIEKQKNVQEDQQCQQGYFESQRLQTENMTQLIESLKNAQIQQNAVTSLADCQQQQSSLNVFNRFGQSNDELVSEQTLNAIFDNNKRSSTLFAVTNTQQNLENDIQDQQSEMKQECEKVDMSSENKTDQSGENYVFQQQTHQAEENNVVQVQQVPALEILQEIKQNKEEAAKSAQQIGYVDEMLPITTDIQQSNQIVINSTPHEDKVASNANTIEAITFIQNNSVEQMELITKMKPIVQEIANLQQDQEIQKQDQMIEQDNKVQLDAEQNDLSFENEQQEEQNCEIKNMQQQNNDIELINENNTVNQDIVLSQHEDHLQEQLNPQQDEVEEKQVDFQVLIQEQNQPEDKQAEEQQEIDQNSINKEEKQDVVKDEEREDNNQLEILYQENPEIANPELSCQNEQQSGQQDGKPILEKSQQDQQNNEQILDKSHSDKQEDNQELQKIPEQQEEGQRDENNLQQEKREQNVTLENDIDNKQVIGDDINVEMILNELIREAEDQVEQQKQDDPNNAIQAKNPENIVTQQQKSTEIHEKSEHNEAQNDEKEQKPPQDENTRQYFIIEESSTELQKSGAQSNKMQNDISINLEVATEQDEEPLKKQINIDDDHEMQQNNAIKDQIMQENEKEQDILLENKQNNDNEYKIDQKPSQCELILEKQEQEDEENVFDVKYNEEPLFVALSADELQINRQMDRNSETPELNLINNQSEDNYQLSCQFQQTHQLRDDFSTE